MMKYRSQNYLDEMIAVAMENDVITTDEVYSRSDLYGGNDEMAMINILWMIWQRKNDKKLLETAQVIYKNYRSDKCGEFDK